MLSDRFARQFRSTILAAVAFGFCSTLTAVPALAQAIAAVVNGDPITTADIEQQMLLLRVLHKPASRNDALEDLIADRIKLHEAGKFGVDATDADLSRMLNRIATQAKLSPQTLANELQKVKANTDIIRTHLHASAAWSNYVYARNKSLNVSEEDVTAALAKDPNRLQDNADYLLQEIVFVVPSGATPGTLEQRLRAAQALRARFQDCASGLALARGLPDVAIKAAFRRDAKSLSDAAKKQLEQTPNGHLTNPERTGSGLQMIAVCGKDQDINRTTIRDNIQADLLQDRLGVIGDKMYKELRATAVIEKH